MAHGHEGGGHRLFMRCIICTGSAYCVCRRQRDWAAAARGGEIVNYDAANAEKTGEDKE